MLSCPLRTGCRSGARPRRWGTSRRAWRWSRRWRTGLCAVSSASVEMNGKVFSTPDDHFTAGPHCRVEHSSSGRIASGGRCPTICAGIVFAASVKMTNAYPAPNDHFTVGPHCRVKLSGSGRIASGRSCPTIRARIVSPAGVQILIIISSAPDNHFIVGPHCRLIVSAYGRVCRAGGGPTVSAGIVFATSI